MLVGYFLWGLLFAGTIGALVFSWFKRRSSFDIFEAKNIFRIVFFVYYGIPSLYYLITSPSFPGISDTESSLRWVILYSLIGLFGFYVGYQVKIYREINFLLKEWDLKKLKWIVAIFSLVSLIAGVILSERVGGVCYYLTHLGQTNVLLVGNIYFVWGLILFKLSSLLILAYYLSTKPKSWAWKALLIVYLILSLLIVTALGARLLLVVYIVELLVLYHYLWKPIGLKFLLITAAFIIVFVVGIFGEYRTFTWAAPQVCTTDTSALPIPEELKQGLKSQDEALGLKSIIKQATGSAEVGYSLTEDSYGSAFISQLGGTASNWQLVMERYINNYFDSVLTTMVVIDNTPQTLTYQYGRSYLALLVQPLPRIVRPSILLPSSDSPEILTGGTGYARIPSLIGEAYLNFSVFGVFLIPLVLGIFSRFAYEIFMRHRKSVGIVLVYAIFIGGLTMGIRGYFVGAGSFFLMDLVPVLVALLILKKSAKVK